MNPKEKEIEEKEEKKERGLTCGQRGVLYAYNVSKRLGQTDNLALRLELEKAHEKTCNPGEEEKEEDE